jgi:hypothetical protein
MKFMNILKKALSSTLFLALIPTLVIFIFLPPLGSKYKLAVESGGSYKYEFCYADLDSDSISEFVSIGKGIPFWNVLIRSNDLTVHDQWNLTDSLDTNISGLFFGNFDHDRFSEIYIFSHSGDSLFLNVNEFFEKGGNSPVRVFISKISLMQGIVTTMLDPVGFYDMNGDGADEVYFSLGTGFGLEPRCLCCFDLLSKKLVTSRFTGVIPIKGQMDDIDKDGKPEIFGQIGASGNYRTNVPYSDSSAWLMVFNEKLEFEFEPVEFPGFANYIYVKSFEDDSVNYYISNYLKGAADTSVIESRIILFSADGKVMKYRSNSDFDNSLDLRLFVIKYKQKDRIYLFHDRFIELNNNLEELRTVPLPFVAEVSSFTVDINADGIDEFLLYSEDESKLAVYSAGLEKYCETKFKSKDTDWRFSHYFAGTDDHKLFMVSGGNGYFFKLKTNKIFYLNFLLYPGIYIMFLLFIFIIKKVNTRQVEQRESMKRRLLTLQLQGIKSQFDPHFTFNALNSVASLVYMDDRKAAYDYLNKFTQLIRRLLNDAERIYRSLEEELEFVTTYLDLEKLRFGDKFNYEIKVGERVTRREQVPKLVLQTFAENAIKHGIMAREDGGMLKISVEKESDYLILTVEDNGIGRAEAAGHSTSTGKGLKLTDEFYDLLNKISRKPIKLKITDLFDTSGNSAGTKVEVRVPVDEESKK